MLIFPFPLLLCVSLGDSWFQPESVVGGVSPPLGWKLQSRANPSAKIEIVIAVKQRNVGLLEDRLLEISDPKSPVYGKWLGHTEVHAFVAPSVESVAAVKKWVASFPWFGEALGVEFSLNYDFCTALLPVSVAEKILQTTVRKQRKRYFTNQ